MRAEEDKYTLSTGKSFYANNGILGIVNEEEIVRLYEGYDGIITEGFTLEEKREIAEYAIGLWKKYGGLEERV